VKYSELVRLEFDDENVITDLIKLGILSCLSIASSWPLALAAAAGCSGALGSGPLAHVRARSQDVGLSPRTFKKYLNMNHVLTSSHQLAAQQLWHQLQKVNSCRQAGPPIPPRSNINQNKIQLVIASPQSQSQTRINCLVFIPVYTCLRLYEFKQLLVAVGIRRCCTL
jgi:hypothetical protein